MVRGTDSVLSWTTANATGATIDQGIGGVAIGSGKRSVTPNNTLTYTMTVTNGTQQATCATTVTVTDAPVPFTCANNVNFSASPITITRGQGSTLSWSVTGATSVSIDNGISTTNQMTGSASVTPSQSTTYTLTAGNGSSVISCSVTVAVEPSGGGGGGGSNTPRCELTASDKKLRTGERVTLRWNTSHATFVEIKDNRNKIVVTTNGALADDKKDLYDGSITVRPTRDTTYTLTAARGSRDRECTVKIDVDDVRVTEVRDQEPLTGSIALADVPYTGVDAKTAVQYTLLAIIVLWGSYLAYGFYRREKVALATR